MKFLTLWFFIINFFCLSKSQAQDTNKIQTFRIYSGEYCMFTKRNLFLCCEDAINYGLDIEQINSVKRMSELVMFENQEFWLVQNSMYVQHKDSLLFFTGTWKLDGTLFRFNFDSAAKPLKYFRKVEYRPQYFKKPIVRNYCALDIWGKLMPYTSHTLPRDFSLSNDSSSYRVISYNNICEAAIPKYLELLLHTDTLEIGWYMIEDSDKINGNSDALPSIKIPLVYSQPIRIRQRRSSTTIKN